MATKRTDTSAISNYAQKKMELDVVFKREKYSTVQIKACAAGGQALCIRPPAEKVQDCTPYGVRMLVGALSHGSDCEGRLFKLLLVGKIWAMKNKHSGRKIQGWGAWNMT
jgi:hypothetical protein